MQFYFCKNAKIFCKDCKNAKKWHTIQSFASNDTQTSKQAKSVSKIGGIAQLGERLHGMQEVSGSIPLTSTKNLVNVLGFDPIV